MECADSSHKTFTQTFIELDSTYYTSTSQDGGRRHETTTEDQTPRSRSASHKTEELFLLNRKNVPVMAEDVHPAEKMCWK